MKHIKWAVGNICELIGGFALLMIILLVSINVFLRYFLNAPITWADEMATIGFSWCIFFGAAACYKRSMHIGIDAFVEVLPPKAKRISILCTSFFLVVLNIVLAYSSWVFSFSAWLKLSYSLRISYFYIDMPAAICFTLTSFYAIKSFISQVKGKHRDPDEIPEFAA